MSSVTLGLQMPSKKLETGMFSGGYVLSLKVEKGGPWAVSFYKKSLDMS